MKKLLYLSVLMLATTFASAQLRNLDFEQWDNPVVFEDPAYNNPTGWICYNRWFGYQDAISTDRFVKPIDSMAQNNKYALRLFTYYNYMKDAAVQSAAINYRPTALNGFYKYEENFIIWGADKYRDTAQVKVWLTKWNASLSQRDTIGTGRFSTHDSTNSFQSFQVTIDYYSNQQPDSITILLDPSALGRDPEKALQNEAHGGRSVFTVDNLSLKTGGTTGVNKMTTKNTFHIYPNPVIDKVNFVDISGQVTIFDISGRKVAEDKRNNATGIEISQLKSGIYFLQVSNKEGTFQRTISKP